MKCPNFIFYFIIHISFLFNYIKNFYAFRFQTIYINDETIEGKQYHDLLFQNELYMNLRIGSPIQNI